MSKENSDLKVLRAQIDAVDNELLTLLGKRQALVEQVIAVKLPARIPARVTEVVDRVMQEAPPARHLARSCQDGMERHDQLVHCL